MADIRAIDGIPSELKRLRQQQRLSCAELSRLMNISPSSVRRALVDGVGQFAFFCSLAAALGKQMRVG